MDKIKTINSIKDEKIILAREVKMRKGRDEHKKILLEGEKILDWAIANEIEIEFVLVATSANRATIEKYLNQHSEIFSVSDGIQKKVTDTRYVVPVVGVGKMPAKDESGYEENFVLVLDDVRDFGNIGTIIRTCQAFGVQKVISTTNEFDIYQRKTIEASRGTVFSTWVERYESSFDTIQRLRERGYTIVTTSPRGNSLQSLVELGQSPVALVVGNESQGVSQEFEDEADHLIQIPMSQSIESLNVGVATGISIYELKLKQIMAMIEKQIKSTLGRELNVAGMLVQKALDAELRKVSHLTSQQVVFMMVLKCDEEMSIEDMRRQFGVLDTEVNDFLKPLLDDALIVRNEKLKLTHKGEEVLGKLWFTVENTERKILAGFSDDETRILMKQLRQIQEKCVEMMSCD